jgi:hypothetical protein
VRHSLRTRPVMVNPTSLQVIRHDLKSEGNYSTLLDILYARYPSALNPLFSALRVVTVVLPDNAGRYNRRSILLISSVTHWFRVSLESVRICFKLQR